jgi:phage shock protein C
MNRAHDKPYSDPDRSKLKLDSENAMIWGVCAGVSDYFGFDLSLTRVCTAVAGVIFFPTVPIIYAILAWILEESDSEQTSKEEKGKREEPKHDPDLSRRVRSEPHATLQSVRFKYRDLDRRLQRLEKHVTSKRYDLERELDGLRD